MATNGNGSGNGSPKKYKVVYERIGCIGAGSCVVAYPERWVMSNTDDKADMIGGKRNVEGVVELEITIKELEEFKASAEVCPVNVIHIIDMETGQKII